MLCFFFPGPDASAAWRAPAGTKTGIRHGGNAIKCYNCAPLGSDYDRRWSICNECRIFSVKCAGDSTNELNQSGGVEARWRHSLINWQGKHLITNQGFLLFCARCSVSRTFWEKEKKRAWYGKLSRLSACCQICDIVIINRWNRWLSIKRVRFYERIDRFELV